MTFRIVQYKRRKTRSNYDMYPCFNQITSFSIDFETIDTKWKSAHSNATACLEVLDYLKYLMILPQLYIDKTKLYGILLIYGFTLTELWTCSENSFMFLTHIMKLSLQKLRILLCKLIINKGLVMLWLYQWISNHQLNNLQTVQNLVFEEFWSYYWGHEWSPWPDNSRAYWIQIC